MARPKGGPRPKLLLLDGHSLAFRAFYALPEDLQTSDGTHTNAVYGFTSMLIKLLQEQKPDYIACCFDLGEPLERTEQFADYKATRTEAPELFGPQLPLIREVLKVMAIPVFELAGYEADDIISYLAKRSVEQDIDVRIVTGDRDFFQLVDDDIKVLYNRRGITDIVEMDAKAVEERTLPSDDLVLSSGRIEPLDAVDFGELADPPRSAGPFHLECPGHDLVRAEITFGGPDGDFLPAGLADTPEIDEWAVGCRQPQLFDELAGLADLGRELRFVQRLARVVLEPAVARGAHQQE
jgi:hypothetical protein